ncbi:uncharacterized protein LOC135809986 [Sycon ciliatum]|uniref:uncharacterized protein LOC135809986 n=1 Tax=Sycon ciliatum TaxID=27933 RepID=UPI0031F62C5A
MVTIRSPAFIALLGWWLSVLTYSATADQTTFDCPMRQQMLQYAHKLQPWRSTHAFQQIADALNGAKEAQHCNVSLPDELLSKDGYHNGDGHPRNIPFVPTPESGSQYYVDTVHGIDTNSGTAPNQAFKTIQKAVEVSRGSSVERPVTVLLLAGTYYMSDEALSLGSADNNLSFQNYQGAEVWLSGARLITPEWKAYNVSPGVQWDVVTNLNAFFGEAPSKNLVNNGTYSTWELCEAACQKNGSCNTFIWCAQHPGYVNQCWFRFDHQWALHADKNIVSGHKVFGPNVYVADLSGLGIASIKGLRVNGSRAIRARFPNANPEEGFGSTLHPKYLPNTLPAEPDYTVAPTTPFRNTSDSYQYYTVGVGGPCSEYDPPASYWASPKDVVRGHGVYMPSHPSGFVGDPSMFPNMPYKDPTTAVVHCWRTAHWFSLMYSIKSYDETSTNFTFDKGGFQGAEGDPKHAEMYIENVFEELDFPMEWFYDEHTQMLYYFHNGTGAPPADLVFEVVQNQVLVNMTGTQQLPVRNISFTGINFRDTAYTYLEPHGVPSGGDWGLQRTGAIFLEGTEHVMFDSCIFERLDGIGVMISGYNRYATVTRSEFVWIGDSAIASWGYTSGVPKVPGVGWDGTDGNHPRYNQITYNLVHELGIWEKQSSFYFQAKSCMNNIRGNIHYNGPRAGVNFNDGFGGGSNLTENVLFNTCRESGDHGPFNSWDRQVFTFILDEAGQPTTTKRFDNIAYNYILDNYDSQEGIDNDDGSAYYETHHNVFVYSGNGMKNDFNGHDNHHHNNIYAYVGHGFGICGQREGHVDMFYNNTLVQTRDGDYGNPACSGPGKTVVHDNSVYTPTGSVTECRMSLADWQKQGNDPGTTAAKYPEDNVLLHEISTLLEID